MSLEKKNRLWLGVVILVGAALAFAGPTVISGITDTAVASNECDHGSSGDACPVGESETGMDMEPMAHQGYATLTGTAVAVDKTGASVTVKLKPTSDGADATTKALSQVKVGDTLSMVMVLGDGGAPAGPITGHSAHTAEYSCPMHPEVTSARRANARNAAWTSRRQTHINS